VLQGYEDFKCSIFELTKIDLDSYKERQMKRRIDALILKYGFTSYAEYVNHIRTDKPAYNEFMSYITINVSEFYRNPEQWAVLENDILPYIIDHFGKSLKVWSAACSTGEEPYSLAMLLGKFAPLNLVNILATDIDNHVMEKARLGLYHEKSLKALPREFIDKYFVRINESTYQICDQIKSCVEYRHHDLLKDPYPSDFDLIVCRNVLIYFTEQAKHSIYVNLHSALKKDAILFIGSTEQILNASKYGFINYRSFFYRKI
jgi:chemotaxis protein methyltransferase CheR